MSINIYTALCSVYMRIYLGVAKYVHAAVVTALPEDVRVRLTGDKLDYSSGLYHGTVGVFRFDSTASADGCA